MIFDGHRKWTIIIAPGESCRVVSPANEEHELFVPKDQDAAMTLTMARAFINRMIRLDQEETPCLA